MKLLKKDCRQCNEPFFYKQQRGRAPAECGNCKALKFKKLSDSDIAGRKTKLVNCRKCNKEFTYIVQRGRPPVECPECKMPIPTITAATHTITASSGLKGEQLAQYLDDKLKALGKHITQHRAKWESDN